MQHEFSFDIYFSKDKIKTIEDSVCYARIFHESDFPISHFYL